MGGDRSGRIFISSADMQKMLEGENLFSILGPVFS